MPKRIQRKRTKGSRMPDGCVYVGRPGKWGNPYRIDGSWLEGPGLVVNSTDRAGLIPRSVEEFRNALSCRQLSFTVEDVRRELAGKDLACWCPLDRPCHADVLLEIANEGGEHG